MDALVPAAAPARRRGRRGRRRPLASVVAALTSVVAALVTALGVSAPARAAEWIVLCSGYQGCATAGYPTAGYELSASTSWWSQWTGHNCTNYVAYRLVRNGMPSTRPSSLTGSAANWGPSFPAQTNRSPAVGAVAWWDTSFSSTGHVAYVEKVLSATDILVSEDNWGGDFRWRRVTASGGRWPQGFIHLKDQGPTVTADPRAWQASPPTRLLDTRSGVGAPVGRVAAGGAVTLTVAGRAGVPGTGVGWALLNVSTVAPSAAGYLTVHASGTVQPRARAASYGSSATTTTLVLSRVGSDGSVRLYTSAAADLTADLVGWSPTGGYVSGGAPSRVVDTRTGLGAPLARLAAGGTVTVPVAGRAGVPSTGAAAVLLDVSASTPSTSGALTTWASGTARPASPQVRWSATTSATGLVQSRIGADGSVTLHSSAPTDVLVDVVGWLPTGADQLALVPARLLDTQAGVGSTAGPVAGGSTVTVPVAGRAGVPATGVRAVLVSVTATAPVAAGTVTAYPSGSARPPYATLRYAAGRTATNTALVPVGLDGAVRVTTSATATLRVDVQGYVRW